MSMLVRRTAFQNIRHSIVRTRLDDPFTVYIYFHELRILVGDFWLLREAMDRHDEVQYRLREFHVPDERPLYFNRTEDDPPPILTKLGEAIMRQYGEELRGRQAQEIRWYEHRRSVAEEKARLAHERRTRPIVFTRAELESRRAERSQKKARIGKEYDCRKDVSVEGR